MTRPWPRVALAVACVGVGSGSAVKAFGEVRSPSVAPVRVLATSPLGASATPPSAPVVATDRPTAMPSPPGAGPAAAGALGASADAQLAKCASNPGSVSATGSLVNPTGGAVDYVVTTSFLDGDGTTVEIGWVRVAGVAAGASADWRTVRPGGGFPVRCVLRVMRSDATG